MANTLRYNPNFQEISTKELDVNTLHAGCIFSIRPVHKEILMKYTVIQNLPEVMELEFRTAYQQHWIQILVLFYPDLRCKEM